MLKCKLYKLFNKFRFVVHSPVFFFFSLHTTFISRSLAHLFSSVALHNLRRRVINVVCGCVGAATVCTVCRAIKLKFI